MTKITVLDEFMPDSALIKRVSATDKGLIVRLGAGAAYAYETPSQQAAQTLLQSWRIASSAGGFYNNSIKGSLPRLHDLEHELRYGSPEFVFLAHDEPPVKHAFPSAADPAVKPLRLSANAIQGINIFLSSLTSLSKGSVQVSENARIPVVYNGHVFGVASYKHDAPAGWEIEIGVSK